jgi:hypothetical protein
MTAKPWIESVHLHPDVLKENAETDIFALDLGPLAGDRQHRRWRDDCPGLSARSGYRRRQARPCLGAGSWSGCGASRKGVQS